MTDSTFPYWLANRQLPKGADTVRAAFLEELRAAYCRDADRGARQQHLERAGALVRTRGMAVMLATAYWRLCGDADQAAAVLRLLTLRSRGRMRWFRRSGWLVRLLGARAAHPLAEVIRDGDAEGDAEAHLRAACAALSSSARVRGIHRLVDFLPHIVSVAAKAQTVSDVFECLELLDLLKERETDARQAFIRRCCERMEGMAVTCWEWRCCARSRGRVVPFGFRDYMRCIERGRQVASGWDDERHLCWSVCDCAWASPADRWYAVKRLEDRARTPEEWLTCARQWWSIFDRENAARCEAKAGREPGRHTGAG